MCHHGYPIFGWGSSPPLPFSSAVPVTYRPSTALKCRDGSLISSYTGLQSPLQSTNGADDTYPCWRPGLKESVTVSAYLTYRSPPLKGAICPLPPAGAASPPASIGLPPPAISSSVAVPPTDALGGCCVIRPAIGNAVGETRHARIDSLALRNTQIQAHISRLRLQFVVSSLLIRGVVVAGQNMSAIRSAIEHVASLLSRFVRFL